MLWLMHPLMRGMDVDDPETTIRRRMIIKQKPFLYKLYCEWYELIEAAMPAVAGDVVELGSGAGFLKERMPGVITTEVLPLPGIDITIPTDGTLPFDTSSLRAIVMTDVLHHIHNPRSFFWEASRCICPGGAIIMIEPWVTRWSRFIYTHFHSEPFRPESPDWEFPARGPLSGANGALPWILFERDRVRFEGLFSEWQLDFIKPIMPVSYLLSGGVSMKALLPGCMYNVCRTFESLLEPSFAMFALIKITRAVAT